MSSDYCTTDDVALWLGVTLSGDEEDVVAECISAASRWIDAYTGRRFWVDDEDVTRTYIPSDPYYVVIDDLVSVTTIKTDVAGAGTFETTWASTDYQLHPLSYDTTRPYDRIEAIGARTFPTGYRGRRMDAVQIVGKFGWPEVPAPIKQACVMWSAALFKRRGSPNGSVGGEEFGPIPLLADRDIERLLDLYRVSFGVA